MAKLVVVRGEIAQHEFPLAGDAVIGRSPECEIVIPGQFCSRQHASVSSCDGLWLIEDLGSANGTVVNGHPITRIELHDGDSITLGDFQLTFLLEDEYVPPEATRLLDDAMATVVDSIDVRRPPASDSDVAGSAVAEKLRAHLSVLREVSETSCGALVIEGLVERILQQLLLVYPQAEYAHAVLLDSAESGKDLHLSTGRVGHGLADVGMSRTLLDIATRERKAVLADVSADERLQDAQSIVGRGLRSVMCSPLVMASRTLGAVQVDTSSVEQPFSADDLQLLVTIAGQLAVAAENARLHREVVAQQRLAAVGQAISSVAHCIKNTVNSLQGGSYILELGIKGQDVEKISKGWEMAKRNTAFLTELVRDMLAYCRRGELRREPTDLGELLKDAVLMVQESAAQKNVETSLTLDGPLPEIEIDPTAVKRVMLNLLTNAIEACSDGCHVVVRAGVDEPDNRIQITVSDDGPGIPDDIRQRLFEPFFTTKGNHGTGLGLALVRKVVEEHHGRVEVESEPGEGTQFHLRIPLQWDERVTTLI